jgi:hypothetical protein
LTVETTPLCRLVTHVRQVGQVLVPGVDLGETGPLSQGVQEYRQALRILDIHSIKMHRKRPRGGFT